MPRKPKLWLHATGQWATSAGCLKNQFKYFGTNKKAAERAFREYLESLRNPEPRVSGRVDDLCEAFVTQITSSDDLKAQRSWGLEFWMNWRTPAGEPNGARAASDVSKKDFLAFIEHMKTATTEKRPAPLSVTSINHVIASVKHAWAWAAAEEPPIIARNPLASVRKLIEPTREPEYIARGQVARILRYARADRSVWKMFAVPDRAPSENEFRSWAVLLRLSYHTGMRLGELAALDWSSVHLEDRQIRLVQHKTAKRTGRTRKIPLDAAAMRILGRMPRRAGPVFLNRDGNPFTENSLSLRFRRLRRALQLPEKFRMTSMRHTVASDLLRAGESTKMVADLLGHTSTRMVEKVYGHLLDSDHQEATERRETFRRRHRPAKGQSS